MEASAFVKIVVENYKEDKGIFKNKVNVEDLVPQQLTNLEKSLYLFYVIQLDYATKSSRLYAGARNLYKEVPGFYNPLNILEYSREELEGYIREYLKPRYINEAVNRYLLNSGMLIDNYNSDPREIFKNSKSCKEVLKKVLEFRGFGPKIGNFYVRTMVNTFNYEYADIENILPPVDVHDVRLAYLMGYTSSKDMNQKNISKVKKIWSNACKKANQSWLTFDKALWLLGSEGKPKNREDIFNLLEIHTKT